MSWRQRHNAARGRIDEGREGKVDVAGYLDQVGVARAWHGDEVGPFVRPIPPAPPGYRQDAMEWVDQRDFERGVVLAEPGRLFQVYGSHIQNASGQPYVALLFFDLDRDPQPGDLATMGFFIPELTNFSFDFGVWGRYFRRGIAWAISTDPPSFPLQLPGGFSGSILSFGVAREREVVR